MAISPRVTLTASSDDSVPVTTTTPLVENTLTGSIISMDITDKGGLFDETLSLTLSTRKPIPTKHNDSDVTPVTFTDLLGEWRAFSVGVEVSVSRTDTYGFVWNGNATISHLNGTARLTATRTPTDSIITTVLSDQVLSQARIVALGTPMSGWATTLLTVGVRIEDAIRDAIGDDPTPAKIADALEQWGMIVETQTGDPAFRIDKLVSSDTVPPPALLYASGAVLRYEESTGSFPFNAMANAAVRYTTPDGVVLNEGASMSPTVKNLGDYPTVAQARVAADAYRYALRQTRREAVVTVQGYRGDIIRRVVIDGKVWRIRERKFSFGDADTTTTFTLYTGD